MSTVRVHLIVKANQSVRVVKRVPYELALDEVAVPINLVFPAGWGMLTTPLTVTMPAEPTAEVGR